MRKILPKTLQELAHRSPAPLYAVGGSVRDTLAGLTPLTGERDWDICSPMPADTFVKIAQENGLAIRSVFKNTGTVKLQDNAGEEYEYSSFRSDKYVRGTHTPVEISFTSDINLDARRRDFTANAVYYDIKNGTYVDPLGGIPAIREKRLTTVAPAEKVFGEDGLRLMRLARQAAQLGFTPDGECLHGATKNAALLDDVTPERVFAELCALLRADGKYGVANGQYAGLCLLDKTRVLDRILPELTLGRGMAQRADFHKYDVLEHSLRAVSYAPTEVRFAALLHDVGKPFCTLRDGNSFAHPEEGARIAGEILSRLKAPKRLAARTAELIGLHMYDFDCKTGENKLRRFFVCNYPLLEELLALKQADFSACTDDTSVAPTVGKWRELLSKIRAENAPLTRKELAVTGKDLLDTGLPPAHIAELLQRLLLHAVVKPQDNVKPHLIKLALGEEKNLRARATE